MEARKMAGALPTFPSTSCFLFKGNYTSTHSLSFKSTVLKTCSRFMGNPTGSMFQKGTTNSMERENQTVYAIMGRGGDEGSW